ncbi:hypothetical protein [Burkholderia metallica]|uniref:hypothetical protein n=1 Tax=Burkholderia metallica TaxID=488729 RepID=UPI00157B6444|nr:hypothetical protein [Burkholderia metallica]
MRQPADSAARDVAIRRLTQQDADGESLLRLTGAPHTLLRRWVDVRGRCRRTKSRDRNPPGSDAIPPGASWSGAE